MSLLSIISPVFVTGIAGIARKRVDFPRKETAMEIPVPREEHQWLRKLIGEWTVEGEAKMGPDQPWEKWQGTETVRAIGELWTLAEGKADSPDGEMTMIITLGFDPQKGRFVGTFVASMMNYLWIYDGALDADKRVLTLDSEGPGMTEGKIFKAQDKIEMVDDNHHILTSWLQGDDGQWRKVMEAHYHRKAQERRLEEAA